MPVLNCPLPIPHWLHLTGWTFYFLTPIPAEKYLYRIDGYLWIRELLFMLFAQTGKGGGHRYGRKLFGDWPQPHSWETSLLMVWAGAASLGAMARLFFHSQCMSVCLRLLRLMDSEHYPFCFFSLRTVAFFTFRKQNPVFRLTYRLVVAIPLLKKRYYLLW